jgi:hypothetical protein
LGEEGFRNSRIERGKEGGKVKHFNDQRNIAQSFYNDVENFGPIYEIECVKCNAKKLASKCDDITVRSFRCCNGKCNIGKKSKHWKYVTITARDDAVFEKYINTFRLL